MALLPPIELPDLSDACPPWLESIFRRYENNVDEEAALAAAEAELTQRSKSIAHQYSDVTPIGRFNDGTDNMDDHEEEDEEEEGDGGDEEYESGGEGDMDDMDADDYYLDDGNVGIEASSGSPEFVSATITLPLPSTTTTTASTASGSSSQPQPANNNSITQSTEQDPPSSQNS